MNNTFNFDIVYKSIMNYGACNNCEHFKDAYQSMCKMGGIPGEYCIINGDEFTKNFNLGKFIICEARDTTGRLYIRTLDIVRDYIRKDGWWNMFTLSTNIIDKEGLWLCQIKRFTVDKKGYPMNIVCPIKYIGTETFIRNNMNAMFLLSKSREFASSKEFSCINKENDYYTNYDPYRAGAYDILYDGYHEELYWLNEIRLAKYVLKEYIAGNVSLPEINSAVTAKSMKFYWTVEEFNKRINRFLHEIGYRDVYPLVYKKLQSGTYKYVSDFINHMMYTYDTLLDEGKVNDIDLYDFTDNHMDLLDMINEVCMYYQELYAGKKEKEKAERKRKRLERRQLEKERKQKEKE